MARLISNGVAHWRSRSQLDDTLDVFPCHGVIFVGAYLLYRVTDWLVTLRVRPEQEEAGLDLSQHAERY